MPGVSRSKILDLPLDDMLNFKISSLIKYKSLCFIAEIDSSKILHVNMLLVGSGCTLVQHVTYTRFANFSLFSFLLTELCVLLIIMFCVSFL